MYLIIKGNERIFVETVKELEKYDSDEYELYNLIPIDRDKLFQDGHIRDGIVEVLKGKQMAKDKVIDEVQFCTDASITSINKMITQMKKEKLIYLVDDLWDKKGNKWIGMM